MASVTEPGIFCLYIFIQLSSGNTLSSLHTLTKNISCNTTKGASKQFRAKRRTELCLSASLLSYKRKSGNIFWSAEKLDSFQGKISLRMSLDSWFNLNETLKRESNKTKEKLDRFKFTEKGKVLNKTKDSFTVRNLSLKSR